MPYKDDDVKIEGFDLTRAQVLEINCQDCGAEPGEHCMTEGGNIRYDPHFLRKHDREKGTDPGPTKSRFQRQVESLSEIVNKGMADHLADVLRRAVDAGIITDDQRTRIIELTGTPLTSIQTPRGAASREASGASSMLSGPISAERRRNGASPVGRTDDMFKAPDYWTSASTSRTP